MACGPVWLPAQLAYPTGLASKLALWVACGLQLPTGMHARLPASCRAAKPTREACMHAGWAQNMTGEMASRSGPSQTPTAPHINRATPAGMHAYCLTNQPVPCTGGWGACMHAGLASLCGDPLVPHAGAPRNAGGRRHACSWRRAESRPPRSVPLGLPGMHACMLIGTRRRTRDGPRSGPP